MKDPFAIPAAFSARFQGFAQRYALRTLPDHIHEIIAAYIFYNIVDLYISPKLSSRLCPTTYAQLSHKTRRSWDSHVVSLVQAILVCMTALWVIRFDEERWHMQASERIWGYTGSMGLVQALSAGYFLWDVITSVASPDLHHGGAAVHAAAALSVSLFGFRPFCNYYGINMVLFEMSTPFLNVHWFIDKLGQTGSTLQLVNGICLITSFAACRIVWGNYQNFHMFRDMLFAVSARDGLPVPYWLAGVYMIACLVLSALNFVWFFKMIQTLRARFNPDKPSRAAKKSS